MPERLTGNDYHRESLSQGLESQLSARLIQPLPEEVRSRSLANSRRWNLEPIDIYPHESNDFAMTQYWRPIEGWEIADPEQASDKARAILWDRYEELSDLVVLTTSQKRKIRRHPEVAEQSTPKSHHYKDVEIPLERVISGETYAGEVPSWAGTGSKSLGEGRGYIHANSPLKGGVSSAFKAVAVEYALRHYGRKQDWIEGVGEGIQVTPFIDGDGELWFRAQNGNTRIVADKLIGRQTTHADVQVFLGSGGEPCPDIYRGSVLNDLKA